jgi:hypothetical protein
MTRDEKLWIAVICFLIAASLLMLFIAQVAFPQDESTYLYDWGSDSWSYETYDHNTDTWTRGQVYDRRDEHEPMWEDTREAEEHREFNREWLEGVEQWKEGYDVYREQ